MSSPAPTFVLVGHCWPDASMLRVTVNRAVPGASVVTADSEADLKPHLAPGCVLLVNRVLEGDFPNEDGVQLIRSALRAGSPPRALLVSNLPEAQQAAAHAGAMPGFGKTQLYDAATSEKLRIAAGLPDCPQSKLEDRT